MATGTTSVNTHIADHINAAIAAGMSESTVDSQHTRAIAILTAQQTAGTADAVAVAAAIALLNTNQAHIHDPRNH